MPVPDGPSDTLVVFDRPGGLGAEPASELLEDDPLNVGGRRGVREAGQNGPGLRLVLAERCAATDELDRVEAVEQSDEIRKAITSHNRRLAVMTGAGRSAWEAKACTEQRTVRLTVRRTAVRWVPRRSG